MVYSLLVITARNWTVKESIQDLKIFFRRDSGFVQPPSSLDWGHFAALTCEKVKPIQKDEQMKAFVLMPFREPYNSYYPAIFKPALQAAGYDEVSRSDDTNQRACTRNCV
jgi:hypothetical protein